MTSGSPGPPVATARLAAKLAVTPASVTPAVTELVRSLHQRLCPLPGSPGVSHRHRAASERKIEREEEQDRQTDRQRDKQAGRSESRQGGTVVEFRRRVSERWQD